MELKWLINLITPLVKVLKDPRCVSHGQAFFLICQLRLAGLFTVIPPKDTGYSLTVAKKSSNFSIPICSRVGRHCVYDNQAVFAYAWT